MGRSVWGGELGYSLGLVSSGPKPEDGRKELTKPEAHPVLDAWVGGVVVL